MRAVVQRVSRSRVVVAGETVGEIGRGLLVLLGIAPSDTRGHKKMNLSVQDVGGSVLVVSQFTLYGDCSKGKRPSFIEAAKPEIAIPLYESFLDALRALGVPVAAGKFGADMSVELVNDGPVTLILERA